ncbi:MAG: DUF177 domain-containing protein [Acidobacteria bacterium]|jgi:uncharacterized protein|nr:DUF177 domain-containing protein [Acidobacteriota bacterium]
MKIDADKIDSKGLVLDDSIALDKNLLIEEEASFLENIDYHLHLSRENEKIKAKGHIHTTISIQCVRCLEPVAVKIDSPIDIILLPAKLIDQTAESLDEEHMEYIFFEGNCIDVTKILMEQINLFIPVKPLCSPSCKGLCPQCGVNLNREQCQCKRSDINRSDTDISTLFDNIKR